MKVTGEACSTLGKLMGLMSIVDRYGIESTRGALLVCNKNRKDIPEGALYLLSDTAKRSAFRPFVLSVRNNKGEDVEIYVTMVDFVSDYEIIGML